MSGRDAVTGLRVTDNSSQPSSEPRRGGSDSVGPSDESLVARAQGNDKAAFRLLIERHQRRIYQLALGILKQHEEAMDVVQETFIKVHQHLPGFKGDAAFSTWTYRIAYNLSIDALRKNSRGERVDVDETTLTDEGTHYEPYATGSASPQKAMLRGELSVELQRALASLGENHRAILILREVDGLSYEELSDVLKIPKGTVMSRLFHARHKMQEALRDYLNDEHTTGETTPAGAGGGKP
jgi:RNA polymerase sigma-70 factor (ECF subfamily)